MARKTRTQIQLDPEEHELLREAASRRRISISQLVREALRKELGLEPGRVYSPETVESILGVAGIGGREPDARRDVAEHHDEILYGERP